MSGWPWELADRAAAAAFDVKSDAEPAIGKDWPTGGRLGCSEELHNDIVAGLFGFLERQPAASPEALYRHGVATYQLFADKDGWPALDEATIYAYRTFVTVARDLIAEAQEAARAAERARADAAAPAPANRNLGKRIGKRMGRAGKKTKLTHAPLSSLGRSRSEVTRESAQARGNQAETLSRQATDKLRRKKKKSKSRRRSSKSKQ